MITASKGWVTGGAKSMGLPVYSAGYTITNTPNTYERWAASGAIPGQIAMGDLITGNVSGAKGLLLDVEMNLGATVLTYVLMLIISGNFSAEACTTSSGGSFTLSGSALTSVNYNTIWITGSCDTASPSSLTADLGAVGDYGGLLVTTLKNDWTTGQTVDLNSLAGIQQGDFLLFDSEIIRVLNIVDADTITASVGQFGTTHTEHLAGTSVYRIGLRVTDASADFDGIQMIRIDDEYILTASPDDANEVLLPRRGMFNSTIASHTSGASIYMMSQDVFGSAYDASMANGWGYESLVNGRMNFDCNIIIGDPEQSSKTIAQSVSESIYIAGGVIVVGAPSYNTEFKSGIGISDEGEINIRGSSIFTRNAYWIDGIGNTEYGNADYYASNFSQVRNHSGGTTQRTVLTACKKSGGGYDTAVLSNSSLLYRTKSSLWKDVIAVGGALNPGDANISFERLITGLLDFGIYFLSSGGANPEIRGLSMLSNGYEVFSFVDGGNKYIINPGAVNIDRWAGFWAATFYYEQYTVDITIQTKDGTPVPNVSVKAWNNADTLVVDETTDVNGQIATQTLTRNYKPNAAGVTNYEPFKWSITKKGWREQIFEETLDEQKIWVISLQSKSPYTGE